jgi:membrane protease YdiL (CAAX protease family)
MFTRSKKKSIVWHLVGLFWNFDEHRLRALWRLATALTLTAILTFALGAPFFIISGSISSPALEKTLLYVAALLAIWLGTRFIDRRPFSDTGVYFKKDWWIDLVFGLVLGALLMSIVFLIELAAGWITVSEPFYNVGIDQPFILSILPPLLLLILVGFVEELAFRGYLLLNTAEGFNGRFLNPRAALILAWLLSSAIFGIMHAFLPNATITSTANIILAGLWLGLGYVLTGSLAIPIGIHITWNFFQGYVFGFPVSGGRDFSATFIAIAQGGPTVWAGGDFGPEGGLIGVAAMLLGILLVIAWVYKRYGKIRLYTPIANSPTENEQESLSTKIH